MADPAPPPPETDPTTEPENKPGPATPSPPPEDPLRRSRTSGAFVALVLLGLLLVLLIAAPGDDSAGYLALLQKIATACVKFGFVSDLTDARTTEALADIVNAAVAGR